MLDELTRLLTMILLSPVRPEPFAGIGLFAFRAVWGFFWMPPAGAVGAGRLPTAVRRVDRRLVALRRWVERISSRDWLSLSDMLATEVPI